MTTRNLFVSVALLASTLAAAPPPTVRIQTGLVSGVAGADGVTAYEGIPFAAPPVGRLRWRPPQPPAAWSGIRAADAPGPACMQVVAHSRLPWSAPFMHQGAVSEDCLHLNLWTAATGKTRGPGWGSRGPRPGRASSGSRGEAARGPAPVKARRPVMVFIYGGGFNEGSDAVAVYNGDRLARRGVVVVTFNYRLGALGFLATPGLSRTRGPGWGSRGPRSGRASSGSRGVAARGPAPVIESPHHVSGNYGLLDQIAALRWVHQNVAAFGGDPANVTIFGQSAGALSVADLMRSPLARGLFAHAIAESGPGLFGGFGAPSLERGEQAGERFALSKGAHSLAQLRALPAQDLIAGGFNPVADGWVLPKGDSVPHYAGARAPHTEVPMMVGMVADDLGVGGGFGPPPVNTVAAYRADAQKKYGAQAEEFLRLYPVANDAEVARMRKTAARDQARVSINLWALQQATLSPRVYTYYFSRATPWPQHPEFGAFHTSEVPYVFENLRLADHPYTALDYRIAAQVSSYWVNFARRGNPNGSGLPLWPDVGAALGLQGSPARPSVKRVARQSRAGSRANPWMRPGANQTMQLGANTGAMPLAATPARIAFQRAYLKRVATQAGRGPGRAGAPGVPGPAERQAGRAAARTSQ